MKRRSVPLGCVIAYCVVWLCLMMYITFEFFSETDKTEEHYEILATQAYLNVDAREAELKTTTASFSATMNYLAYQQQHLATATPH
jgi:hypothetical protein